MPGISDTGGQSLEVSCPSILLLFYLCVDRAGNCQLDWRDQKGGEKKILGRKEESFVHPVAGPHPSNPLHGPLPSSPLGSAGCFCEAIRAQKGSCSDPNATRPRGPCC